MECDPFLKTTACVFLTTTLVWTTTFFWNSNLVNHPWDWHMMSGLTPSLESGALFGDDNSVHGRRNFSPDNGLGPFPWSTTMAQSLQPFGARTPSLDKNHFSVPSVRTARLSRDENSRGNLCPGRQLSQHCVWTRTLSREKNLCSGAQPLYWTRSFSLDLNLLLGQERSTKTISPGKIRDSLMTRGLL